MHYTLGTLGFHAVHTCMPELRHPEYPLPAWPFCLIYCTSPFSPACAALSSCNLNAWRPQHAAAQSSQHALSRTCQGCAGPQWWAGSAAPHQQAHTAMDATAYDMCQCMRSCEATDAACRPQLHGHPLSMKQWLSMRLHCAGCTASVRTPAAAPPQAHQSWAHRSRRWNSAHGPEGSAAATVQQ